MREEEEDRKGGGGVALVRNEETEKAQDFR